MLRRPNNNTTPAHTEQAFFDFRMRRSLAKVVKVRRDRASLPIAAYQDAIVRAVASNPCVLVAGDTGCGKSTQVSPWRADSPDKSAAVYLRNVAHAGLVDVLAASWDKASLVCAGGRLFCVLYACLRTSRLWRYKTTQVK